MSLRRGSKHWTNAGPVIYKIRRSNAIIIVENELNNAQRSEEGRQ